MKDRGFWGELFDLLTVIVTDSRFWIVLVFFLGLLFLFLFITEILSPELLSDIFPLLNNSGLD